MEERRGRGGQFPSESDDEFERRYFLTTFDLAQVSCPSVWVQCPPLSASSFQFADDSGGVVNLIKHNVLILVLPKNSADVMQSPAVDWEAGLFARPFPIIRLWRRIC